MSRVDREVEVTKISSRGQVVIPKKVREKMQWEAGEHIIIEHDDDTVLMRKMTLDEILKEADDDYANGRSKRLRSNLKA